MQPGDRVAHIEDGATGTVLGQSGYRPDFWLVSWDDPDLLTTSAAESSLRLLEDRQ